MPIESRRALALAVLAAVLATAFIAIPAWQLLVHGPFSWHVRQPAYWQGGLEALALIGVVACTFVLAARRWVLAIAAIALLLFLRRHAVDVALLLDVLYLEIVIGLGAFARRMGGLPPPRDAPDYLQAFVLGFATWSVLAWTASALDVGSIRQLRWLTLLLGVPALFGKHRPFIVFLCSAMRMRGSVDRFWCGTLTAWLAVLYARSNVAIGYDSLWYGLRPEYVLDPHRSVFEPLGLTSPVHYYPKLYEVFLLPLSALGDGSTPTCVSVWLLALILLACHQLGLRVGVPQRARLPILATIATLPALASVALGTKPDVIALLFLMLAANAALAFLRDRRLDDALWLLACATLACLTKLTAVPFAGALVLATMAAAWHGRARGAASVPEPANHARSLPLAVYAAGATMLVAAFVIARTWLLTGMPSIGPDSLFRLWGALGMTLKEPAGTLNWTASQIWSDVPTLIVDWLFRPQTMPHVVTAWVGNVWLWLGLLGMAAGLSGARIGRRSPSSRWPLAGLMVAGMALALFVRYGVRGSDGNYFLAALLPAIIVTGAGAFGRLANARQAFVVALACLPAFTLFQAAYSFASASWTTGTKTFDFDLGRGWKDSRHARWAPLRNAGLERIGHYLKERDDLTRSVGYVAEPASFLLPSRFEYLTTISYSRPEYLATPEGFIRYLRDYDIEYLILPQPALRGAPFDMAPAVLAAADRLQADPAVRRIDDRDYFLLDLSRHARAARTEQVSRSAPDLADGEQRVMSIRGAAAAEGAPASATQGRWRARQRARTAMSHQDGP
jgi:hypothetical protein